MSDVPKRSPFGYTIINILGSLIPLLAVFIVNAVQDQSFPPIVQLSGRGEATIICVSLLVGVCYTLFFFKKEVGTSGWHNLIFWITCGMILLGTTIYTVIISTNPLNSGPFPALFWISMVFVAWSVVAVYSSQVIEARQTSVVDVRHQDGKKLEQSFDKQRSRRGN